MTKVRDILVTGSSSGIGRAMTTHLLAQGHRVIGVARRDQSAAFKTQRFVPFELDLSKPDLCTEGFKRIFKVYPEIDAVVSNAGSGVFKSIENISAKETESFFRLNLLSHVLLARVAVPKLKARGGGNLIFLGSESALTGAKLGSLYCTAKFGLRGLAQSLRAECANKNVRVSIVNPGLVRTPFFEKQSFGPGPDDAHAIEAGDVAEAVAMILNMRDGTVIDEINLSPRQHVLDFDSAH
ncbi:MAG: SDR family oxidoreductase [Bradymonadia bacterium]